MNWRLLQNSIVVAGGSTLACLVLGMLMAVWLLGLGPLARRAVLGATVTTVALPPFLVTNAWLDLVGQGGPWYAWFPFRIFSLWGTGWVLALLLWPITALLALAGMEKLEPTVLEAEPLLRGWPLIRRLLLPMARPALVNAAMITFALAFNNFAVPAILQAKVFPAELWVSFNTTFDYRAALKLSCPLLFVSALLWACLSQAPVSWPRLKGKASAGLLRRQLGNPSMLVCASVSLAVLFLSVGVPLGQLGLTRKTWFELPNAFAAGSPALLNSLFFAWLSASLCVATGWGLWRLRASRLLWMPFLLPGVLVGIALIFLLNRGPTMAFYQSVGIVVLALTLRYAILGWSRAHQAMGAVDGRLLDYAKLNGASRWQLARHVYWPQVAPELGAVWLLIYLLCLWDVESLVLIIPPGCETLALRIFNLLHYGHNVEVNALCVLLLGLALCGGVVWAAMDRLMTRGLTARSQCALIALVGASLLASGCRPGVQQSAPLESALFSGVQIIGSRGTALGHFNKPRSLALDAQDNVYVVDMTGRVQKFSADGAYLASWQMPETEKGKPKGMCRDAAGNIVVVEPHYTRVNHFSPQGKLLAQWGVGGTNDGQLCLPRAAAVTPRGDIIVCEYTLVDRVQRFAAEGKQWKATFGHSGSGVGEFNRPEGLAVDKAGRIYVADSCNHRIQVFTPEGQFLRSYGHAGIGRGELSYPYDVQVDADGLQYVAEFGNSRIQVFDREGHSLEILGGSGSAPGKFSNPWSLALDSVGNLYVADSQNHRVQKFLRKRASGMHRGSDGSSWSAAYRGNAGGAPVP
ncbi:MAG: hypothetical protein U1G07_19585 [Verrucomicrobiota bacterium]